MARSSSRCQDVVHVHVHVATRDHPAVAAHAVGEQALWHEVDLPVRGSEVATAGEGRVVAGNGEEIDLGAQGRALDRPERVVLDLEAQIGGLPGREGGLDHVPEERELLGLHGAEVAGEVGVHRHVQAVVEPRAEVVLRVPARRPAQRFDRGPALVDDQRERGGGRGAPRPGGTEAGAAERDRDEGWNPELRDVPPSAPSGRPLYTGGGRRGLANAGAVLARNRWWS
jgi:hypothetical protein